MSNALRRFWLALSLFSLWACTASVAYPDSTPYDVPQKQQRPPPPVQHPVSTTKGGSLSLEDSYRSPIQEQIEVYRQQDKELAELNKYWTEQFNAKPDWKILTCDKLVEQEKKSTELKAVIVKTKAKHAKAHNNTALTAPMINRKRLLNLEQLSIRYEQWVEVAKKSKFDQADHSIVHLAKFTSEYYLHLNSLTSDPLAGAVADARVTISTLACTEEQLATLTKQIDEYEAKSRSAFAFETECRASTKCVHDRAMNEAMSSLVPGICEDIQNLSFLRGELVRLRSNPSGVVNLYELNKTGDAIQGIQAEMAEQKTEFIKTTGQQFYPALCAKVPQ